MGHIRQTDEYGIKLQTVAKEYIEHCISKGCSHSEAMVLLKHNLEFVEYDTHSTYIFGMRRRK